MRELAVVFGCQGEQLVGVISLPETSPEKAVVIIVGGPQYRIGSHRQFVRLARHLADNGVAAMRFDTRGMGDSSGDWRTFCDVDADVGAAIEALCGAVPTVRSVALWGLCGGAIAALSYWHGTRDSRVRALTLVNPWVRSDETRARTFIKHYYLQRAFAPDFWCKLFRGRVNPRGLLDLYHAARLSIRGALPAAVGSKRRSKDDLAGRMADALADFSGPTLLILSGNDFTAREFLEAVRMDEVWQKNFAHHLFRRLELSDADHTFPQAGAHAMVERATLQLANEMPR